MRILRSAADIRAIVAAFVAIAVAFSIATPPFEGPDEIAHFAYAKSLADGRGFPQPPISIADGEPAQETTQPPLYYLVAAGAIRAIAPDSADIVSLLRRNRSSPTVTAETANDNKNVFVPVSERAFPPRGTALAIQVARLVTIACGAAAIAAFTPQFIFVSTAVSNNNSVVATCSIAIWLALRIARRGMSFSRAAGLGVAIGLAALSKASALTLGPLVETLNALNTYWLAFGWGIIMLPDAAYLILNGLAFAGLGAAACALRSHYDPTARAAGIFAFVWLAATAIAPLRWNQLVHAAPGPAPLSRAFRQSVRSLRLAGAPSALDSRDPPRR